MSNINYSAPPGGNVDFEYIFVTEDYNAAIPAGPGLCIYCDVTIESFGILLPGGADALGKIYAIKLTEPTLGRTIGVSVDGGGIIEFGSTVTLSATNESIVIQCVGIGFYLIIANYDATGGGGGDLQTTLDLGGSATAGTWTGLMSLSAAGAGGEIILDVSTLISKLFMSRNGASKNVTISTSGLTAVRNQTWADDDGDMFLKHVDSYSVIATGLPTAVFNIPHLQPFTPEYCSISINDAALAAQLAGYALTWDATNIIVTINAPIVWAINLEGRFFVIK